MTTVYDIATCAHCNSEDTTIVPPSRGTRWCFTCKRTFDSRKVFVPAPS